MASIVDNQNWRDFFECYKSLPELWQMKSQIYKNKSKKRNAWLKLLEIYQEIEKGATIYCLKRRICNIRTCFRRELKKVETSRRAGAGPDEEYVPRLWYYEALDFLCDEESQHREITTVDDEDEDIDDAEEDGLEDTSFPTVSSGTPGLKRKKCVGQYTFERNELLKSALEQLTKSDESLRDDATIYAEAWATSYRKLSNTQQLYAKKAIEEILVLGQLGLLTLNSVKPGSQTYLE